MRDLLAEEEGEEVDYGTDELEADEVTPEADSQPQILEARCAAAGQPAEADLALHANAH